MIDIAKKRPPTAVLIAILYVSFCASMWFVSRGSIAYFSEQYMLPAALSNDVTAFIAGGMIPTLVFVLLSSAIYRNVSMRVRGDIGALRLGVYYSVIAANIVLFAVKFVYIAAPLYASILETILDPTVTVLFVGLYMVYAFRMNYVEKNKFGLVLMQVLGTMAMVYGLLALIGLVVAVA